MRKLKLQVQISIDGFIAGPKGEMDWMAWDWDDALKEYVNQLTGSVDCILLGRKLAEGFIPHWAGVAADPGNPEVESGKKFTETPKVVFSRTPENSDPMVAGWDNTVLAKGDLVDEVNSLKQKDGKDIIAYGGAEFVSHLIREDLIDEYYLFFNPAALGEGMSIFRQRTDLKYVASRSFNCGITVLRYQSAKAGS